MTITVVDAFAERPFTGNPAAVCVLDRPPPDGWMRDLAAEMNLSETAFLTPTDSDDAFRLRWFTPESEVDLCGHATLASAHVLFETGRLAVDAEARFDTNSGRLTVQQTAASAYAMDFPSTPPEAADLGDLAGAFGAVDVIWTGRTPWDAFVVLGSEAEIHALAPNADAVRQLSERGVIVTARANADSRYDVVSRFFAPEQGIPEDPVTGSAHCAIGPYWTEHLGSSEVSCYQASRRGGQVEVHVRGERVALIGQAVTVYRAELAPTARPDPSDG